LEVQSDRILSSSLRTGTICSLLLRDAENIISADSFLGSVPNSSQKRIKQFKNQAI